MLPLSYIKKIIKTPNKEICGKNYNYLVKEYDQGWKVYRRQFVEDEFELVFKIKKEDINEPRKWKKYEMTFSLNTHAGKLGLKSQDYAGREKLR